jgi:16S rRNA (uracil1498-N3)-methyltransferase
MDEVLRRSAAHVLVADVAAPAPDDGAVHHLRRVLRLRDGDAVTVTDGAGRWRPCRLAGDGFEPTAEVSLVDAPVAPVTIAVAPPKGDRLEWLVQKCTEVGVDQLVVVAADRSVVRWDGSRAARHLDRLRRVATDAAMQSRRVWLPAVSGPVPAAAVLPGAVVAEPGGRPLAPSDTVVAIGPEGGWAPAELALAADTVSLGDTILRVETAAVVAATLLVSARAARR